MSTALDRFAAQAFLSALPRLRDAGLTVVMPDGQRRFFGERNSFLQGHLIIHSHSFFRKALFGGEVGLGEAYVDGLWSSPDLTGIIRIAVRNMETAVQGKGLLSYFARLSQLLRHRGRSNSVQGSRRNIQEHYDLSNEFFQLFLDKGPMMYSSALFESEADTLEKAQLDKLDRICRLLRLSPGDHVLEIGTGWGGFAAHAALNYGCRVTTTTISEEQHAYAAERFDSLGVSSRVELLFEDYRNLKGRYDRIVSIEMFEAVGLRYYDAFFGACQRLLDSNGAMMMQTITMNERNFPNYQKATDWIQQYIFPGGELASVLEIQRSLARVTNFSLHNFQEMGAHYARTLAEWRERFHEQRVRVEELGFDDNFQRTWDYYLGYCEGAFLERYIGVAQLLLVPQSNRKPVFGEPWDSPSFAPLEAPLSRL
jgi:cyclopropane-fatty-acyl-phospholipid synthase